MKRRKKLTTPIIIGIAGIVVLAVVGVVGALNGWFGGGGSIPSDTMTRGLVGYWSFDEGSGITAYDASGNGNDGTLYWMSTSTNAWTTGKSAGALQFDGADDYVSINDNDALTPSDSITVSAWIKRTATGRLDLVIGKGSSLTNFSYNIYFNSNDTLAWEVSSNGNVSGRLILNTTATFTSGVWYHIVGIFSNGSANIYVNGINQPVTTSGTAVSVYNNTANLFIGYEVTDTSYYFRGTIDEVRIYNRALSDAEVRYHYNRGGPVVQWKFDEGSGSTAYDSTDNHNDGHLYLAPSGNTATSSAWVTGKYGTALSFDGTDDYVDVAAVSGQVRTISFWLKRGDTSNKDIIDLGTPEIKVTDNAITTSGFTSPTYYVDGIKGAFTITANQWHHVAIIDTADINASNVDIGKASSNYFYGLIDDVKIYNYTRTPEQIRIDYNAGLSTHFK